MSELKDFDNNAPTDAEKWLELYKKFGSNLTAYTDKGHLENVIDWLIGQVDEAYREGIAWEVKRNEMERIIKGENKSESFGSRLTRESMEGHIEQIRQQGESK